MIEERIAQMIFRVPGGCVDIRPGWFIDGNKPAIGVDDGIVREDTGNGVCGRCMYRNVHPRQDDGGRDADTGMVYPRPATRDNRGSVLVGEQYALDGCMQWFGMLGDEGARSFGGRR